MYRILFVEDDLNIREMINDYFEEKGKDSIILEMAENGLSGLEKAYENIYDLLLLDIMLPEVDGFEICKEIRRYSDIPIMFITARTSQEDILTGYALGCDDYIVKPFSLPVLFQKVNALIKRSKGLVRSEVLTVGMVCLNPSNGIVTSNGNEIVLTPKEFSILKVLMENKGNIVSRTKLIDLVWGYNNNTDLRVLDAHIKNLRKALGDNSKIIKTIIKRGYKVDE